MTASYKICESWDDVVKCIAVRSIVFCGEQHISYQLERDEHDASATHILCELEPVAAARLRFFNGYAKLERIAVRAPWRGQGLGHGLTQFMRCLRLLRDALKPRPRLRTSYRRGAARGLSDRNANRTCRLGLAL